ncbi:hypothetical protein C8J56DRAFT_1092995 [Mycena floridula]|nr:hypothetical protein C8J56DRAFT_1092995 [Mycena floridula]
MTMILAMTNGSDKKYCHCTPDCTAFIGYRQRLVHYSKAPEHGIRDSTSPDHSPPRKRARARSHSPSRLSPASVASGSGSLSDFDSDSGTEAAADNDDMYSRVDEDLSEDLSVQQAFQKMQEYHDIDQEFELFDHRNEQITEADRDNIRAFKLKIMSNMSRRTFDAMRSTFSHRMDLGSEWTTLYRIAVLSGV